MLDAVIMKLFISPCWKAFDFFYMKTSDYLKRKWSRCAHVEIRKITCFSISEVLDTGVDSVQRLLGPKNLMWVRRQQYYRLLLISLGRQCDASQNIFAVVVSSLKQQNDFGATLWASLRHTSPWWSLEAGGLGFIFNMSWCNGRFRNYFSQEYSVNHGLKLGFRHYSYQEFQWSQVRTLHCISKYNL